MLAQQDNIRILDSKGEDVRASFSIPYDGFYIVISTLTGQQPSVVVFDQQGQSVTPGILPPSIEGILMAKQAIDRYYADLKESQDYVGSLTSPPSK